MNSYYIKLLVVVAVIATVFGILWRKGHLLRLRNYILETREELRKCTWPSWDELKGSTVLVMITMALLGLFTITVDFALSIVNRGIH